jgi:hypothetical protein
VVRRRPLRHVALTSGPSSRFGLGPDLVRGAVVHAERARAPADVHAEGLPRALQEPLRRGPIQIICVPWRITILLRGALGRRARSPLPGPTHLSLRGALESSSPIP